MFTHNKQSQSPPTLSTMKKTSTSTVLTKFNALLLLILLTCFTSLSVGAKSHNAESKTSSNPKSHTTVLEVTKDSLQAKIESVNNRKGLEEELKTKVLSIYQTAQDNLNNIENYKARNANFSQSTKLSSDALKKYLKDIEQILSRVSKQNEVDLSKLSTEELAQREILEKSKISALDEQLKTTENELILQESRPALIREEIVVAKQDLDLTQKKIEQPTNKSLSKLEAEANLVFLKTQVDARSAELKMLEIEALSNPARVELLKAQYKLLDLQKNELTPIITAIDGLLTNRREQDAKNIQAALAAAEKELEGKHPLIQNLTRENIQYTRDLQAVNLKIESYTVQKTKVDADSAEINAQFKSADKRINLAAISPELGKILRDQRRNLDSLAQSSQESENIQKETAFASLEAYKSEDKLKKISELDSYIKVLVEEQVDAKLPNDERLLIQAEARALLSNQKELLNKLGIDYTNLIRILGDFDFSKQQLSSLAEKFSTYLDENLLWVKSSDPVNLDTPINLFYSVQWFLSPLNWLHFIKDIGHLLIEKPVTFILGILLFFGFQVAKAWAQIQLNLIAANFKKKYSEHFVYTLQALAFSLLTVLPYAFLCGFMGWLLTKDSHLDDFSHSLGSGLKSTAITLLFLNYFYLLFEDNGIIRRHFMWHKSQCQLLRKQLHWVRYLAISTTFIVTTTVASNTTLSSDNLGRLAYIVSMIAIAIFWGRILNPKTGLVHNYLEQHKFTLLNQLRYVWFAAIYIIPAIMIGFAIAGYYLSALQLQGQLISSMRLIFSAIIIHQIVVRWLTLINHQLALSNAEEQRKAELTTERPNTAASEDPILPNTESIIDIPKINAQTTRLLNVFISLSLVVGFWMIWKNLLPAFSFLDDIVLWQHLVTHEDQKVYEPITLSNLLIAFLYLFIAVVSVINLSGVMEIVVFRRLEIEAGTRYAFNQLANYLLITVGFISISNELGGSWTQVQWLVAALSVGLGFGLQEIFANLVSGIILLFERPIRVSDTVTIGSITGKVSRIQMRATTLIDWDQKEHIVPNKNFITNQLVNWTLSDTITRLEIIINIAYGSDLELANQVMFDCVMATPQILREPAPSVLIVGFGDSSVVYSVRIYVDEMSNRLPVTHELFINIEKALRAHNIEMPYPQRDIHIKSLPKEFNYQP